MTSFLFRWEGNETPSFEVSDGCRSRGSVFDTRHDADGGLEVMDGAREAVGREPLGQGIGLEEGAIDLLGLGAKDTMEANAAG